MEQSPQREPPDAPEQQAQQPEQGQQAGQGHQAEEQGPAGRAGQARQGWNLPPLPPGLVVAAGWGWRLLVLGAVGYALVRILALVRFAVLAVLAALLFTALLHPVARLLRRYMPALAAAFVALLVAVAGIGGVGYFVGIQTAASIPTLVDQLTATLRQVLAALDQLPGIAQLGNLEQVGDRIGGAIQRNSQQLTNLALTGGRVVLELMTGLLLAIVITFFFVYEGERLWGWLLARMPTRMATRTDGAGRMAWRTISGYVQGVAVIGIFHAVVIGLSLFLLGVPLVIPLAVLMFLGAFVPIVGAVVAGGLAVFVAFGSQGLLTAGILLGVLLIENQVEGNILQPLVMGHYVRLHPLAILLALTVGSLLAGIVGAIVAVPVAAVVYRAVPALLGWNEPDHEPAQPAR